MALYNLTYASPLGGDPDDYEATINLSELSIYGSSRIGQYKADISKTTAFTASENYNSNNELVFTGISNLVLPDYEAERLITNTGIASHTAGTKFYELSNHLGNVLSVISDKRIPIDNNQDGTGATVLYYTADVVSYSDYYPFGMPMPGRNGAVSGGEYRYGFNGQEKDDEVKGSGNSYDFGDRIYDCRIGRWMSTDKLMRKYPYHSPYIFVSDSPIFMVDLDGNEGIVVSGQPGGHGNKEHFLANGLFKAKAAQKKLKRKDEKVTWIIFNDGTKENGHDPEMLEKYKAEAKNAGINVIVVTDASEIVNYVNNKNGEDSRKQDPITSFYYVGHATPGELNPGYNTNTNADSDFEPHEFNSDAFASGCHVNLIGGCNTAVGWYPFYDSAMDDFADILDNKSTVYGADVKVYYPGDVVSDEKLVEKNNGNILSQKGKLPDKNYDYKKSWWWKAAEGNKSSSTGSNKNSSSSKNNSKSKPSF